VNRIGNWEGNRNTRYNESGDKALVDIEYATSEDRLTHTATFHRIDRFWRLRGIRETFQAFAPRFLLSVTPDPPNLVSAPLSAPRSIGELLRSLPPPEPRKK
jgi:hypothetical protein